MHKVAIVGASGFTGAELMRICAGHPEIEVVTLVGGTSAGQPVADIHPHLAPAYPGATFTSFSPESISGVDLAFLALPHGESAALMPEVLDHTKRVVDLAGDFRFRDPAIYEEWYGASHPHPELLDEFAFGLPELFREDLAGARAVAVAGCYVTASSLALAPVVAAGLVEPNGIVVDAASGVSGAGRGLRHETSFTTVDENYVAYGLAGHRHTPEIEMAVSAFSGKQASVVFTPHLAPMNRGILATCYARTVGGETTDSVLDCLRSAYANDQFVDVSDRSPTTKSTLGSNYARITARVDARTGWTIVVAAIDNLVKGAAGQAVQCANLSLGLDEGTGLDAPAVYP